MRYSILSLAFLALTSCQLMSTSNALFLQLDKAWRSESTKNYDYYYESNEDDYSIDIYWSMRRGADSLDKKEKLKARLLIDDLADAIKHRDIDRVQRADHKKLFMLAILGIADRFSSNVQGEGQTIGQLDAVRKFFSTLETLCDRK